MRGGYIILQFNKKKLTSGSSATLKGSYDAVTAANDKAVLISGLVVGSVEYDEMYIPFTATDSGYVGQITLPFTSLQILVASNDAVTVTVTPIVLGLEADFDAGTFTRIAGSVGLSAGSDYDSIAPWARKRCNVTDGGVVTAYYGDDAYTETGALEEAVTVGDTEYPIGTAVQVMVEQPKFWYKVEPVKTTARSEGEEGVILNKARYYISTEARTGFSVHPAFIRNSVTYDKIYLSAYEGCAYDVSASKYIDDDEQIVDFTASTGDMLSSIADVKPMSGSTQSATRAGFRQIAANRGTGWSLGTIQSMALSQLLFAVEYAGFNSQTLLGAGITTKAGNSSPEATGYTSTLGNASGTAQTSITTVSAVTYRGEENLWGNIWKFIDGVNIYNYNEGSVYIADHSFADSTKTTPYTSAGITVGSSNGYIKYFGYSATTPWLFIPVTMAASTHTYVDDQFSQNKAQSYYSVGAVGGNWSAKTYAGIYAQGYAGQPSGIANILGSRLLYIDSPADTRTVEATRTLNTTEVSLQVNLTRRVSN